MQPTAIDGRVLLTAIDSKVAPRKVKSHKVGARRTEGRRDWMGGQRIGPQPPFCRPALRRAAADSGLRTDLIVMFYQKHDLAEHDPQMSYRIVTFSAKNVSV